MVRQFTWNRPMPISPDSIVSSFLCLGKDIMSSPKSYRWPRQKQWRRKINGVLDMKLNITVNFELAMIDSNRLELWSCSHQEVLFHSYSQQSPTKRTKASFYLYQDLFHITFIEITCLFDILWLNTWVDHYKKNMISILSWQIKHVDIFYVQKSQPFSMDVQNRFWNLTMFCLRFSGVRAWS